MLRVHGVCALESSISLRGHLTNYNYAYICIMYVCCKSASYFVVSIRTNHNNLQYYVTDLIMSTLTGFISEGPEGALPLSPEQRNWLIHYFQYEVPPPPPKGICICPPRILVLYIVPSTAKSLNKQTCIHYTYKQGTCFVLPCCT